MKAVVAWSGGKDSCFACSKATENGHSVKQLLVMMFHSQKSSFHMIPSSLLDAQSQSLGIPLAKCNATPETYEKDFKKALLKMKTKGAEGLITGDVYDVALHEPGWLERICKEVGLTLLKPLWHHNTRQILAEFLREGFKATMVRVKTSVLGMEWLGRQINKEFYHDLQKFSNVDPCGEQGEFHTFVTDGPLFRKRIEILESEKMELNGYGHLKIKRFKLEPKE